MVSRSPEWDDPANAAAYRRFVESDPLFRSSARDLVDLALPADAAQSVLVDLACGTGLVAALMLERADQSSEVIGIDASAAMLDEAAAAIDDPRVRWVHGDAAAPQRHVARADAMVCAGAIWAMGVRATLASASRVLEPGGRIAFDVATTVDDDRSGAPSLLSEFIRARSRDTRGDSGAATRSEPTVAQIRRRIADAGLVVEQLEVRRYDHDPRSQRAMLDVPVFAKKLFPGLPPAVRSALIDDEFDRWEHRRTHVDLVVACCSRPRV